MCRCACAPMWGEDYLVGVLNDVNGSASSLTLAADGSVMLDSGYEALEQGASGVADGLDQMASGTSALVDGTAQIADGVVAAGTGAQALADGMNTTTTELVGAACRRGRESGGGA